MIPVFFVSDLHGKKALFEKLFNKIRSEKPSAVFIGGDILPHGYQNSNEEGNFLETYLIPAFTQLKKYLKDQYPNVFIIFGNDDPAINESLMLDGQNQKCWYYIHNNKISFAGYNIFGYSFVPPSPFFLKDWEKYDVSRYIDPGCIPPDEGWYSIAINKGNRIFETIAKDLVKMTDTDFYPEKSIFLFHSPPYQTNLDRAALDGQMIDWVPLDVNVGSIAIRRFIESVQPYITLHGHIHESSRITGSWKDKIIDTFCFTAAYDGSELALIKIDLLDPEKAIRELI